MRWVRRAALLVAALVVVAAGYVGYAASQSRRTLTLPEVAGRFAVGRREATWTDPRRPETLTGPTHRRRVLSAWIWYPAARASAARASYAPGAWDALHLPGLAGLAETAFASIRTAAVEDASPSPGTHPLVVLAPGLGFAAPQYQALAETLAAHGYVVAAFTPTYSSNVTVLGGRVVRQSRQGSLPDGSLYRPDLRSAAHRLLTTWVADARLTASRARNAVRGLRVGYGTVYVGHSFGGAAALEACHEDTRCVGAADLDGLQLGAVVDAGLDVPVLLAGHQNSCVTGVCRPTSGDDRKDRRLARRLIAAGRGPAWSVRVDDTEHFDFTDYAAYRLAYPLRRLLPVGTAGPRGLLRTERCLLDLADRATHRAAREGCLAGDLGGVRTTRW